jgi:hypothetical protein
MIFDLPFLRMSTISPGLAPFVARIEQAYASLGHELGWRFLYGPARTLAPGARLVFVGLNPGGGRYHPPMPSVEEGNAYRVERWGGRARVNPLQLQIGLLYGELARKLGESSPTQLMDETLAVNFCPFRSRSWETLASPVQSIAFSRAQWRSLLDVARPAAIVCLGDLAARHVGAVLGEQGSAARAARKLPVGWGNVTCALTHYDAADTRTLLVRLPHLSRFGIFGRPASAAAVEVLTDAIVTAMA